MAKSSYLTGRAPKQIKPKLGASEVWSRGLLLLVFSVLTLTIVMPLFTMLVKSLQNKAGAFVGFANVKLYLAQPGLLSSLENSLFVAVISSTMVLVLAFLYAYGLNRTSMPCKGLFRVVAFIPILTPSLLQAISLIYLFGNQGIAKEWLFGASIYGPVGIIMGLVVWSFPACLMIMSASLRNCDGRLYEAAEAMGAGPFKRFFYITLPSIRYGLFSAFFLLFTLTFTDFGIAKVIGGQFNVLATDLFKQVVGQQNFQMGAMIGVVLLIPSIIAFTGDRLVRAKQAKFASSHATTYQAKPSKRRDLFFFVYCAFIATILLGMLGMAAYASFVTFWPYDLSLSFNNYQFDLVDGGGWEAFVNSITLALYCAIFGSVFIFCAAYLVERTRGINWLRNATQMFAMIPMAVPGLVLGLSYIFFFNHPANPFNAIYGGMAILVISTVVHYYSVNHLTAIATLNSLNPAYEQVSASLKVPLHKTFFKVIIPISLPAILDISTYLFTTAMTTVSAVIFLYSADTKLASVAVINMEGAGDIAPAAAMSMVIAATAASARLLQWLLTRGILKTTQNWRI